MAGEFELIERYFGSTASRAALGIGDDCALLYSKPGVQLALSTDMLAEGTHFVRGADPGKLGRKALAVNLSDLAAMGADPAYVLLAICLPAADESWLAAFAEGFFAVAKQFGVELIGGDTTRGPLAICVTVVGEIPSGLALRRDAAMPGDDVWLSGATGEAALALAHMNGRAKLADPHLSSCLARLDVPVPRVELGGRLRGLAHSAIDVSDGLLADLGHVARASHVAICLQLENFPRAAAIAACGDPELALQCIAGGGDDYELAFTAAASRRAELEALGHELGLPLTRIGTVTPGSGEVVLMDASGKPIDVRRPGFDHFA
jgi:thiamine-monophosphate kinase